MKVIRKIYEDKKIQINLEYLLNIDETFEKVMSEAALESYINKEDKSNNNNTDKSAPEETQVEKPVQDQALESDGTRKR